MLKIKHPLNLKIKFLGYVLAMAGIICSLYYIHSIVQAQKINPATGSLIITLIISAAGVCSYLFIRLIIRPLEAISDTAVQISKCNLSLRVNNNSGDEIGILANCFNQMLDSFEKRNNKLKEQNKQLKEINRLKSEFIANMSHELRTPLNAIMGFSQIILKEIDGPTTDLQKTDISSIYNSGKHLLSLINDLLDLAKIESGKLELKLEEQNVKEMVSGIIKTCMPLIQSKPLKLIEKIEDNLPDIVVDKTRFRQILLNILSNAIKFTDEGQILLQIKKDPQDNNFSIMSITDTGIGIKRDNTSKVFEKFKQISSQTGKKEEGAGLGMAITKEFVEIHGGSIEFESKLGAGTTFYIRLPIKGPAQKLCNKPVKKEKIINAQPEKSSKKIMVIEDDKHMISLYKRYLTPEGYNIIIPDDLSKAAANAKEHNPYAIILDIMLPHKDGWEIIQELKSDPQTRKIPVIISSVINKKNMGFSLGATAYLVKPFGQKKLLQALSNLNNKAKKIAIIDDKPDDAKLIKKILGNKRYTYKQADNTTEGFKLIQQETPDVVIADLISPFEMLSKIRTDDHIKNIPIIIISANKLEEEKQARLMQKTNITSFLQKGNYNEEQLIRNVLDSLHLRQF